MIYLCNERPLSGDYRTTFVAILFEICTDCWEIDYFWVTCPADAVFMSSQQRTDLLQLYEGAAGWVALTAASVSTVPFFQRKEKKRRAWSGEEGRRHYRKAGRNTTFTHAICSWIDQHTNNFCCSGSVFQTKHHGDCYKLSVVSCARPAQHYVGTTMDRIIIEKATWWTEKKTAKQIFYTPEFPTRKTPCVDNIGLFFHFGIFISTFPAF